MAGLLPAIFLFLIAYIRFAARESWTTTLMTAVSVTLVIYLLFHVVVHLAWPGSLLGDLFPALRAITAIGFF